jgi:hypothetical protein
VLSIKFIYIIIVYNNMNYEHICKKRKINKDIIKDINNICFDLKNIRLNRKRKTDDQEEKELNDLCILIEKNKLIKKYGCNIHDDNQEICSIYNCSGNISSKNIEKVYNYIN